MAMIRMSSEATVLTGRPHFGYTRQTTGTSLARRVLLSSLSALDGWRQASTDAHKAATKAELATSHRRALEDLRATYTGTGPNKAR